MDTTDNVLAEGAVHPVEGLLTGCADRDQFSHHRVIQGRNDVARVAMGVDTDAVTAGRIVKTNRARAGGEIAGRIFRVDTALNGVATDFDILLVEL